MFIDDGIAKRLKAPAGRHVYSWATCKYLKPQRGGMFIENGTTKYPKAPEGRHVSMRREA